MGENSSAGGFPQGPDVDLEEASYRRGLFRGLTPNVIRLGFVSFFVDVSSDMFLIQRANDIFRQFHPLHATVLAVWVYVLYNLMHAAASPTLGSLSDRLGQRAVLVGATLLMALHVQPTRAEA